MKKGEIDRKRGFTIIEVLLVLAIAGLIFLMMFIALPALNRSQRDSRRRDDISILLRKVKDYQTNNRGALPTEAKAGVTYSDSAKGITWMGFYHDYLGENFTDPSGSNYILDIAVCTNGGKAGDLCNNALGSDTEFPSHVMVFAQATCDGEQAVATNNPRKLAVQYKMEGGGIYCANT